MWLNTGNAFEGFQAQSHWGVQSITNLINIPAFLIGFCTPVEWHAFRGSALDRFGFLFLVSFLPIIWKLDKSWFIWAIVLGVVPALSGTFSSYTRFQVEVFPLFAAVGVTLAGKESPAWRWGILCLFVIGQSFLLWRFVEHGWVG